MTTLFLLNARWDRDAPLVATLKKKTAEEDSVVLALDFWAAKKLRDASLAYERPDVYLNGQACRDLDISATRLARTWYEPIGEQLHHQNISLAQMAEYDFTFLFIDALRSIAIAQRVFDEQRPSRVVLCPRFPLLNPNAIGHESLPAVMTHLALRRNVPVSWAESTSLVDRPGGLPNGARRYRQTLTDVARRFVTPAREATTSLRAWTHSILAKGSNPVLFMQVSYHARIARFLSRHEHHSLSISPIRRGWMKGKAQAASFSGLWDELRTDSEFQEGLRYDDVLLSEVLDRRFREFFQRGALDLIEVIEGAEWLIRRLKPRMLVVPVDLSPISRAVSRTFRNHGLPVLVLQHGAVSVDLGGFHVMPVEGQKMAVWGEMVREWHIQHGKPPDSQVVTGNAGFDPIAGGYDAKEEEVRRRLGLQPDEGIITLATQWSPNISSEVTLEGEERAVRHTLKALRLFPQYQVVIKLHPNYQATYEPQFRAMAEEEGMDVTIAKKDLWDLLRISDLVIVTNSTVGIEAMILGRPVVVVHLYEGVEPIPYVASEAALGASNPEEIASAIGKALDRDQQRQMAARQKTFIQAYAYHQDGKASNRVAQLIGDMLGEASQQDT